MTGMQTVDGYRIRPIEATDRDLLRALYAGLSPDARAARFHAATRGISEEAASAFCGLDHRHREGFVAEASEAAGSRLIGHLCLEPIGERAFEVAVVVADPWQGRGVGRALLRAAMHWARAHGSIRLVGLVGPTNGPMLGLLRSSGAPLDLRSSGADDVEATLELAPERRRAA